MKNGPIIEKNDVKVKYSVQRKKFGHGGFD